MKRLTFPCSIGQLDRANNEAGLHYFESSTMRFFRSLIHSDEVSPNGLFITSEQAGDEHPRLYSIRQASEDGSINTLPGTEFQQFASLDEADEARRAWDVRLTA